MAPMPPLDVLYEDNHLLAVNKPAGLPTMGVADDVPSLLTIAKQYVKVRYQKPGNVYLGAMSRLDAPVTGIVLLARTSKAAARLTEQFRTRTVDKLYWAIVTGPIPDSAELVDFLAKDERHRRMHVVEKTRQGAQEARLSFRRIERLPAGSLLEVRLETGRKHQIRLQLSSRGWPVLGDRKYGGTVAFTPGIALHARQLRFEHPTRDEEITLVAPLPPSWRRFDIQGTAR
ncbi:MAG TPA: RluA family pseudouridine synthase [Pirellulales bacterium]|jgi:23S rRNA pseudouridine1911/1915/1917 synthase|nr:RluA family pseudouridine synthase [Pirellulales bacterium]